MELPKQLAQYVPWSKSWLMRMGVLDLVHGTHYTLDFLQYHSTELNDDLEALQRVLTQWNTQTTIDVGESGTLLRFVQYLAWHRGEELRFVRQGTLATRPINTDASVVSRSVEELLKLDSHTSQWASAAVLIAGAEVPTNIEQPYHLQMSVEAVAEYKRVAARAANWSARKDRTIQAQVISYCRWRKTGTMEFTPEQSEDYCFARVFDLISTEEGERRWPNLHGHESDRIVEVESALKQHEAGELIGSADHRVVQALALRYNLDQTAFKYPGCVAKTWPLFWGYLTAVNALIIS